MKEAIGQPVTQKFFKTTLVFEGFLETRFFHASEESAHTFFRWCCEFFGNHEEYTYQVRMESQVDLNREKKPNSAEQSRRELVWGLWKQHNAGIIPVAH
jgi:hypothetical protein